MPAARCRDLWTRRPTCGRSSAPASSSGPSFPACLSCGRTRSHASLYDLGILHQVLWNTAHGRPFASSVSHMSYLGDHFSPTFALLAPLEWLPRSLDLPADRPGRRGPARRVERLPARAPPRVASGRVAHRDGDAPLSPARLPDARRSSPRALHGGRALVRAARPRRRPRAARRALAPPHARREGGRRAPALRVRGPARVRASHAPLRSAARRRIPWPTRSSSSPS